MFNKVYRVSTLYQITKGFEIAVFHMYDFLQNIFFELKHCTLWTLLLFQKKKKKIKNLVFLSSLNAKNITKTFCPMNYKSFAPHNQTVVNTPLYITLVVIAERI